MRSQGSFLFWTVFNLFFLSWDVFFATAEFSKGETAWGFFFVFFAVLMAISQVLNVKLRRAGIAHEEGLSGKRSF